MGRASGLAFALLLLLAGMAIAAAPVAANAGVRADSYRNLTTENLTATWTATDGDAQPIKNITDWLLNGNSIAICNFPFEGGSQNGTPAGVPNATRDYSGYGHRGNATNATWNASGGYDGFGAYMFNGTGYIDAGAAGASLASRSVSFWINAASFAITGTLENTIYAFNTNDGGNRDIVRVDTGGRVGFYDSATMMLESSSPIPAGTWHHFVMVTAPSGSTIYQDGQSVGSTGSWQPAVDATDILYIAQEQDGSQPSDFFNGTIDEFMVFGRALSQEQVFALYRNRTDRIVSNETDFLDRWAVCITPNDGEQDGAANCSANLTVSPNLPPQAGSAFLRAPSPANSTTENLTLYWSASDYNNDSLKNVTNWHRNGTSIAVLNMPFEGGSQNGSAGGTANGTNDYSGFGNNGTVYGAIWNSTGGHDGFGAYQFDGSGNYIDASNSESLRFGTGNFSVGAWVKYSGTPNYGGVVAYWKTGLYQGYQIRPHPDGKMYALVAKAADGLMVLASANALNDGNWHHVMLANNGTSDHRLYVDGVLDNQSGETTISVTQATNNLFIGRLVDSSTYYFNGSIDDVMILNRSLSAQEVWALYNNRTDRLVAEETVPGDVWGACVTPNDGWYDGNTACSNNLSITAPPFAANATVSSALGTNRTTENLTAFWTSYDTDSASIKNVTSWYRNGTGIATLVMPFEADTRWNATDYSGFGHAATVSSLTYYPAGGFGGWGAYRCTASTSAYANISGNAMNNLTDFTIMMWIRHATIDSEAVLSCSNPGQADEFALLPTNTNMQVLIKGASDTYDGFNIGTNQWHHVAFRRAGTRGDVFLDGEFVETNTVAGGRLEVGPAGFILCQEQDSYGGGFAANQAWEGYVDELMVFNRSLSDEQILALSRNLTSRVVYEETSTGDLWSACVTPHDGYQNGSLACSGNLTVLGVSAPAAENATLNSSYGTNRTTENLTAYWGAYDTDNDTITNITNWFRNGTGIAVLNMPFEGRGADTLTARDYSPFGNDGGVYGARWSRTGGYGGSGAYVFDGGPDYLRIADHASLKPPQSITLEVWFNAASFASTQKLLSKTETGSYGLAFDGSASCGGTMSLCGMIYLGGSYRYVNWSTANLQTGRWYHAAMAYSNGSLRLYVNGTLVDSEGATGTIGHSSAPLCIGAEPTATACTGGSYFNGTIDGVRIHNRSLSAEQVLAQYLGRGGFLASQETGPGDMWNACITPNDGYQDGAANCSNALTVLPPFGTNGTPPNVTTPLISPSTPTEMDDLNASTVYTDTDGDSGFVTFMWYVNGTNIYNYTTPSVPNNTGVSSMLSKANFSAGDYVNVSVQANDTMNVSQVLWSGTKNILGACVAPSNDLLINVSTSLCAGTYNISDTGSTGVIIANANGITITCLGTVLIGTRTGSAFYSSGRAGVTIAGCTVLNYSLGMNFASSTNITLRDNLVGNTSSNGIYLAYPSGCTVSNNTVTNATTCGIYLHADSGGGTWGYSAIENNTVYGPRAGSAICIIAQGYSGAHMSYINVTGNNISDAANGLYLYQYRYTGSNVFNRYNRYAGNDFRNTTRCIYTYSSNGGYIQYNEFYNNTMGNSTYGVYFNTDEQHASQNNFSGNRFYNITSYAVYFPDGRFYANRFWDRNTLDGYPFYHYYDEQNSTMQGLGINASADATNLGLFTLVDCLNVTLRGSNVTGDREYGVYLYDSKNATVADCAISGNGNSGTEANAYTYGDNGSSIRNNTIYGGRIGIYPYAPDGGTRLENNSISNTSSFGIYIEYPRWSVLLNNTIRNATTYGILLYTDSGGSTWGYSTIENNTIYGPVAGSAIGIYADGYSGAHMSYINVTGNNISDATNGLYLFEYRYTGAAVYNRYNLYAGNDFRNTTRCIYAYSSNAGYIQQNEFINNTMGNSTYGVYFGTNEQYASNNNFSDNRFYNITSYAVYFPDSRFYRNRFWNRNTINGYPFYHYYDEQNSTMHGLGINASADATNLGLFTLVDCLNVTLRDSNVTGDREYGTFLWQSDNLTVERCAIFGNGNSGTEANAYTYGDNGSSIRNNEIYGGCIGIYPDTPEGGVRLENNTISNTTSYGMYLTYPKGCAVLNNTIINATTYGMLLHGDSGGGTWGYSTIENNTIYGPRAGSAIGIYADGYSGASMSYINVTGNNISDATNGLYLYQYRYTGSNVLNRYNRYTGNDIRNTTRCIHTFSSNGGFIMYNDFSNNTMGNSTYGVYFNTDEQYASQNNFSGNRFYNITSYAVYFPNSWFYRNRFWDRNTLDGYPFYHYYDEQNSTVEGRHINTSAEATNLALFTLVDCLNVTLRGSNVTGAGQYGVYLYDSDNSTIDGCTLSGNGDSGDEANFYSYLDNGSILANSVINGGRDGAYIHLPRERSALVNNTIENTSSYGVLLYHPYLCNVSRNTIRNATTYGVYVYTDTGTWGYSSISDNNITGPRSGDAVRFRSRDGNIHYVNLTGNSIRDAANGMYLSQSDNGYDDTVYYNRATGNNISNTTVGIYLFSNYRDLVRYNLFDNNSVSNSTYGLYASNADANTISYNNFTNCVFNATYYPVYFSSSRPHNNSFTNTTLINENTSNFVYSPGAQSNFTNLTLQRQEGHVKFLDSRNLAHGINATNTVVASGIVSVDSVSFPAFAETNAELGVRLYGNASCNAVPRKKTGFTNDTLFVVMTGFACYAPDCHVLSCGNGSILFNSSVFSAYAAGSWQDPPVIENVTLNSTFGTNYTDENLTAHWQGFDPEGNPFRNMTDWRRNGTSIAPIYLAFEGGSSTPNFTKSYARPALNASVHGAIWNESAGFDGYGAYSFTRTESDYMRVYDSREFNPGSIAVAFYAKFSAYSSQGSERMLAKRYGDSGSWAIYRNGTSGAMEFWVNTTSHPGGYAMQSPISVQDGAWYHLAFTYGAGGMKAYVNGQLNASDSTPAGTLGATQNSVCMGAGCDAGSNREETFNGTLDEVRVFNRSISARQVLAIYENRSGLLLSNELAGGDVWAACITPNDKVEDGNVSCSNNLTVLEIPNNPPNITAPVLLPADPTEITPLNASATYSDLDNDSGFVTFMWYVNNVNVYNYTSPTIPNNTVVAGNLSAANFTMGDYVNVSVQANDTRNVSGIFWSGTVLIQRSNLPPNATAPVLAPPTVYKSTLVYANTTYTDANNNTGNVTFLWRVNGNNTFNQTLYGVTNGSMIYSNLTPDYFNHSDYINCSVFAFDGINRSATIPSVNTLQVQNTPPNVTAPAILPAFPNVYDTLNASSAYNDLDLDGGNMTFMWFVNNANVYNQTIMGITNGSSATGFLSPSNFTTGNIVNVTAIAFDGMNGSQPAHSAPVTIGNVPPAVTRPTITPPSGYKNTTFNASTNYTNTETGNVTFMWRINNINTFNQTIITVTNGSSVTSNITGQYFSHFDYINCSVFAFDGINASAMQWSTNTVQVSNTPPQISAPVLAPDPALPSGTLNATTTYNDSDSDAGNLTFMWFVNNLNVYNQTITGVANGSTVAANLSSANYTSGDRINASLIATDGYNSTGPLWSQTVQVYSVCNLSVQIDEVETSAFPNSGVPYAVRVNVTNPDGSPLSGADIRASEISGWSLFGPVIRGGYTLDGFGNATSNSSGESSFALSPTRYNIPDEYGYSLSVSVSSPLICRKSLSITTYSMLTPTYRTSLVNPSYESQFKSSVQNMNALASTATNWINAQKQRLANATVNLSSGDATHNSTLKAGAPNLLNITTLNASGSAVVSEIRIRERDGFIIYSPLQPGKAQFVSNSSFPSNESLIIIPTGYNNQANLTLEAWQGGVRLATFSFPVDSTLSNPGAGESDMPTGIYILISSSMQNIIAVLSNIGKSISTV